MSFFIPLERKWQITCILKIVLRLYLLSVLTERLEQCTLSFYLLIVWVVFCHRQVDFNEIHGKEYRGGVLS